VPLPFLQGYFEKLFMAAEGRPGAEGPLEVFLSEIDIIKIQYLSLNNKITLYDFLEGVLQGYFIGLAVCNTK
jgi:hypothetical protein